MLLNTFYNNIVHWLEMHYLACPVKTIFHIDCPGCGIQRSFVELLKGNFKASFYYHPVTVPLLAFIFFSAFHLGLKFKNGNRIIVATAIFISVIIISNYIYKIVYQKPA